MRPLLRFNSELYCHIKKMREPTRKFPRKPHGLSPSVHPAHVPCVAFSPTPPASPAPTATAAVGGDISPCSIPATEVIYIYTSRAPDTEVFGDHQRWMYGGG